MSGADIYERVFRFACRVMQMDRMLARNRSVNRNALNQLVSSASSIGANLEEARAGQSKADEKPITFVYHSAHTFTYPSSTLPTMCSTISTPAASFATSA